VREPILAEELERVLPHPDACDLPVKLDEIHVRVHRIADDRAAKAGKLSRQLIQVAGVLIDMGLPPIEEISQLPKTTQDALLVVTLVLKHLQEALDSSAGPWD
jgi:hypothetical protein